jgi:endo-1,4-beta-xylanase
MKKPLSIHVNLFVLTATAFFAGFAIPTMGQLADGKCKFLGNVISNSVPSSFNTYWNQVTPENAGKWGSVEGTRDVMNWSSLDMAYNHAKNNGFPFRFHTLIWGNQQPLWIADLPAEEQLEEIVEWFSLAGARYPDPSWPEEVPFFIDVVNEPIHDPPNQGGDGGNYIQALSGPDGSGYDWIVKAFELAREYFPAAKLHINEYNIINNDSKTTEYITIINILKAKNLIDGIGIQCHRFEVESATVNQLKSNLDRLAGTGLPIYVTEFDIGNIGGTGEPNDAQQLEIYQRVFPVLWTHPAVQGITLWGYLQNQIWQPTAFLVRSDGTERPAMTWLKSYIPTTPGGTFCLTTGIEQRTLGLNVFPNPSPTGRFILESTVHDLTVSVSDIRGRTILHKTVKANEPTEVHVSDTPGMYLMKVYNGQRASFKKLIVQK